MAIEEKLFSALNSDDSDRDIPVGDYRSAYNLSTLNDGVSTNPRRENVKGNMLHDFSLPVGRNRCIGTYEDTGKNRLIIFNFNNIGLHGIYAWNPITDTFQTVLIWSGLAFFESSLITGIGIVEDLLYWTDGNREQRVINIQRGINGGYTDITKESIRLHKAPPSVLPIVKKGSDNTLSFNRLNNKNFQFAYRYIYLDNETSVLGPYSDWAPADVTGSIYDATINNFIQVRIPKTTTTSGVVTTTSLDLFVNVKKIELVVREKDTNTFVLVKSFSVSDISTEVVVSGLLSTTYYGLNYKFYNNETSRSLPEGESFKLIDSVPTTSTSLALFKNRNFIVDSLSGVNIFGTFNITTTIQTVESESGKTFKQNGKHNIGVVFYDEKMNPSSVQKVKSVNFPQKTPDFDFGINEGYSRYRLKCKGSGTVPTWAKYFQYVRTKELNFLSYIKAPVMIFYYIRSGETPGDGEFTYNGNIYLISVPTNTSQFSAIHLQVPDNIPIAIDTSFYVRLYEDFEQFSSILPVKDVQGNMVVLNKFIIDIPIRQTTYVEIYQEAKSQTEGLFYETASLSPISSWTNDIYIDGDDFVLDSSMQLLLRRRDSAGSLYGTDGSPILSVVTFMESPTTTKITKLIDFENSSGTAYQNFNSYDLFTLDYSSDVKNIGRPNIINADEKESRRPSTIRFSNTYIQDSNINGLSSFDDLNEYPLPIERGPINKLLGIGNVLLAIHDRETTSLYIGEGVIQSANGEEILTKTNDVISADRLLEGGYGTINPESVVERNGMAFWWDMYKGCVIRYTNAGIYPISNNKMKKFFAEKQRQYLPFKDTAKIIGGYNPFTEEYLLTFPAITGVEGVTVAFNVKQERFTTYYSFVPEYYGKINNKLVSFKGGKLWVHGGNSVRNNFYGVQYPSSIELVSNAESAYEKTYNHIGINSNSKWDVPSITNNEGQETDLIKDDFYQRDNMFYADILRDKNTPEDLLQPGQIALRHGKPLRSQTLNVTLENDSTEKVEINSAYVSYTVSPGHLLGRGK